mmetsp:Transcript_15567/g.24867  ORF Transcript_15567/g.24867 Transcript_15567/m.24867 type:complete len:110 (-) Transcript_15567:191-520(-)
MAPYRGPPPTGGPPQALIDLMDKCVGSVPPPLRGFCAMALPATVMVIMVCVIITIMYCNGLNMQGKPLDAGGIGGSLKKGTAPADETKKEGASSKEVKDAKPAEKKKER